MAALVAQSIIIYRGERVVLSFTMSPVENITGWTLKFTVTKAIDKSTKVLGPLAMTVISGVAGTFEVILTELQTDLKAMSYAFDVWRTDQGFEEAKAIGSFIVLGNSRVPPTE